MSRWLWWSRQVWREGTLRAAGYGGIEERGRGHARLRGISSGAEKRGGRSGVERHSLEIDIAHIHTVSEQRFESLLTEVALQQLYVVGA